jgi:hypothetical protein
MIMATTLLMWMPWNWHLWVTGRTEAMFSTILRDIFLSHPMLTFLVGVIIGHIFWPIR